jgi:hypothetical protein
MAVATTTFQFINNAQNWGATTGSWTGSDGSGAVTGCLETKLEGKNISQSGSYFEVLGTWHELLNIPLGSTINQITNCIYDWKIPSASTAAASTTGPVELRTFDATYIGTLQSGSGIGSATTAWATVANMASPFTVPSTYIQDYTPIRLRLAATLATGNSTTARIMLLQDTVTITVDYNPPNGTFLKSESGNQIVYIRPIPGGTTLATINYLF